MRDSTRAQDVHFGVDRYVRALVDRLERHFEASADVRDGVDSTAPRGVARGNQALVVGILGPWGCGKTTWLRAVQSEVLSRARTKPVTTVGPKLEYQQVTVPILFNAWQYEREPHLIVPLLKTAEARLRTFSEELRARLEGPALEEAAESALRRGMMMMGDAVFAMMYALQIGFTLGLGKVGKLSASLTGSKAVDAFTERREARQRAKEGEPTLLDAYQSLYYDLLGFMRSLTRPTTTPEAWKWLETAELNAQRLEFLREASEHSRASRQCSGIEQKEHARKRRLADERRTQVERQIEEKRGGSANEDLDPSFQINLLFLIDDLDRCLPEKAVQMLESIKLFLEAPGCAFVLGIDDEIVEHAIRHRYADYRKANATLFGGTEYLEKMIQLPIRVPPLSQTDTKTFLQAEYPRLFAPPSPAPRSQAAERGRYDDDLGTKKLGGGTRREGEGERDPLATQREELLRVFSDAVPGVPRKLIRAAELFGLLDHIAGQRTWPQKQPYNPVLLLRLAILQLFAPSVFRMGLKPHRRDILLNLIEVRDERDLESVANAEKPSSDEEDAVYSKWERRRFMARELLRVSQERAEFDARCVVVGLDTAGASGEESLGPHYRLVEEVEPTLAGTSDDGELLVSKSVVRGPGASPDRMAAVSVRTSERPHARLKRPSEFVALATSADPLDWKRALGLEEEALQGSVLGQEVIGTIIERASSDLARFNGAWFETFLPVLSLASIETLFRAADPLGAAVDRGEPTEAVRLLSMVCRHFNPPHRPPTVTIRVVQLRPNEARTLDLSGASMWNAYLVGLHDQAQTQGVTDVP